MYFDIPILYSYQRRMCWFLHKDGKHTVLRRKIAEWIKYGSAMPDSLPEPSSQWMPCIWLRLHSEHLFPARVFLQPDSEQLTKTCCRGGPFQEAGLFRRWRWRSGNWRTGNCRTCWTRYSYHIYFLEKWGIIWELLKLYHGSSSCFLLTWAEFSW